MTARILAQGFLEDLLGLGVATVGHVDLGLGDGIHLMAVDAAHAHAAEVRQQHAAFGGRALGRSGCTSGRRHVEHGVVLEFAAGHDAVFELGQALTATAAHHHHPQQAGQQQRGHDPADVKRVADEGGHPAGFGLGHGKRRGSRCRRGLGNRRLDGDRRSGRSDGYRCFCRLCGRRLRRGGLRRLGCLLGLQFQQFLHVLDRAFKVGHTFLRLAQRATLGGDLLLQAVQTLLNLGIGLARRGARITFGQLENVLWGRRCGGRFILSLGFDGTGGRLAFSHGDFLGQARQLLAIGVPLRRMALHQLVRFPGRIGHGGVQARDVEHLTALEAVHVVAQERCLVGLVKPDHHLFQGHFRWPDLACDGAQGFASLDRPIPLGRLGRRGRLGQGLGLGRLGHRGRHGHRTGFSRAAGLGDHGRLDRLGGFGVLHGIQQHGVFADQPSRAPVQFDQQVQEGVRHARSGADADDGLTVGPLIHGETQTAQGLGTIDAGLLEGIVAGQLGGNVSQLVLGHREQLDLGPKWLSQGGLNGQLAQAGGLGHPGSQQQAPHQPTDFHGLIHRIAFFDCHSAQERLFSRPLSAQFPETSHGVRRTI